MLKLGLSPDVSHRQKPLTRGHHEIIPFEPRLGIELPLVAERQGCLLRHEGQAGLDPRGVDLVLGIELRVNDLGDIRPRVLRDLPLAVAVRGSFVAHTTPIAGELGTRKEATAEPWLGPSQPRLLGEDRKRHRDEDDHPGLPT